MRLFVDVDGVLLNFEAAFTRYLNRAYGLNLPEHYESDSFDWAAVLKPNNIEEAWAHFLESPEAGQLPTLVEVARFNTLARKHAVHLLTNFPEKEMWRRVENLERAGIVYESLHHCGFHKFPGTDPFTKAQMLERLREPGEAGLFVDDHPENCLDVRQNCANVEVWLMSRRFNQDFAHPEVRRAKDWGCVFDRLGH